MPDRYTINKLIDEVIDRANPNLTRIERRQFVLDNTKYLGNLITPKKVSDRLRFRDNQLQNAQNVQAAQAAQAARAVHAQTIQTVQTVSPLPSTKFRNYIKKIFVSSFFTLFETFCLFIILIIFILVSFYALLWKMDKTKKER